ncbi:MAG: hypothetical protein ACRD1K_14805 [Acidimicrobiales bacterium]
MTSPNQFRPRPPPAYGSPEFRAVAQELIDIKNSLTPEQEQIARFYEGGPGTKVAAGIIVSVASDDVLEAASADAAEARLTFPRVTRALALLTVSLSDAGIAAWDARYVYWNPRPENAIGDLGLDREWTPVLDTPASRPTRPAAPATPGRPRG